MIFAGTGVRIEKDGCRHLGAALGTPSFVEEYVANKVTDWVQQIRRLAEFASTQHQAAYSAFIQGLQPRWSFLSRTLEDAPALFGRLEDVIRDILIPALTGHAPPSSQERALLAFPCRHGGLGISHGPNLLCPHRYFAAQFCCKIFDILLGISFLCRYFAFILLELK